MMESQLKQGDSLTAFNRLPLVTQDVFSSWKATLGRPELFVADLNTQLDVGAHEDVVRLMQSLRTEEAVTALFRIQYNIKFAFSQGEIIEEHVRKDAELALGYIRLYMVRNYQSNSFKREGKAVYLHDQSRAPFAEFTNPKTVKEPINGVSIWKPEDERNLLAESLHNGVAIILQKPKSDDIVLIEAYGTLTDDQYSHLSQAGMNRGMRASILYSEKRDVPVSSIQEELVARRIVKKPEHIHLMPIPADRISVAVRPSEEDVIIDYHDATQHARVSLSNML